MVGGEIGKHSENDHSIVGSNPTLPLSFIAVSSNGIRTPPFQGGKCEFESRRGDNSPIKVRVFNN